MHQAHDIEPWPGTDTLARMMRDATIVVFDNLRQTVTIAGDSHERRRTAASGR